MIRLSGDTYFALLRRPEEGGPRDLRLFSSLPKALASWGSGGRISPLFPFTGTTLPDLQDGSARTLLLFGPVYPGRLPEGLPGAVFLTYGLYNILWVGTSSQVSLELCKSLGCPWELWTLEGPSIVAFDHFHPTTTAARFPLPPVQASLQAATAEYAINLSAILERSRGFTPTLSEFIKQFASKFTPSIVRNSALSLTARQTELVLANAALSRYSSQTFSGTSPIAETECHFWSHSLVGIGSASLALLSIRSFVQRSFSRAQLIERFFSLQHEPATPEPLSGIRISSDFWLQDHLASYASQEAFNTQLTQESTSSRSDQIPLLTCFSGRDGFRSTRVSLSAPLETLSSGNTPAWSLLTLTHEMSHPIVEALLGMILPRFSDPKDIEDILSWFGSGSPKTFLGRLREYVLHALLEMSDRKPDLRLNPRTLRDLINDKGKELNELLAHAMDFLYFYGRDPTRYVAGIWLTWGAVPNIEHRVRQYLIRTLCALHTANTMRQPAVTVEQAAQLLFDLNRLYPRAPYVAEAALALRDHHDEYEGELRRRAFVAAFARGFLFSETLAKVFESVSLAGSGKKGRRRPTALVFPPEKVDNPIQFIESAAVDKRPHPARSAWLLSMLAFADEAL